MRCRLRRERQLFWLVLTLTLGSAGPACPAPIELEPDDASGVEGMVDLRPPSGVKVGSRAVLLEPGTATSSEGVGVASHAGWPQIPGCTSSDMDVAECEHPLRESGEVAPMVHEGDTQPAMSMTGDTTSASEVFDDTGNLFSDLLPDLTRNETVRELLYSITESTDDLTASQDLSAGFDELNLRSGDVTDEEILAEQLLAVRLQAAGGPGAKLMEDQSLFARAIRLAVNPWSWVIVVLLVLVWEGCLELFSYVLARRSQKRKRRRRSRRGRHGGESMRSARRQRHSSARTVPAGLTTTGSSDGAGT